MALEEMDTEAEGKNWNSKGRAELVSFIEVMAYMVITLGLLYYVLGCLCVQQLKHKVYKDFEKRRAEVKSAQKGIAVEPKAVNIT